PVGRLFFFLENACGWRRPVRFRLLGERVVAPAPGFGSLEPPPPLPGLPPALKNPIVPPGPGPLPMPADMTPQREGDELANELARVSDDTSPQGVPIPGEFLRSPSGRIVDVDAMARAAGAPLPSTSPQP